MYIQCIASNHIKLYFTSHATLFEQVCKEAFSSSKCWWYNDKGDPESHGFTGFQTRDQLLSLQGELQFISLILHMQYIDVPLQCTFWCLLHVSLFFGLLLLFYPWKYKHLFICRNYLIWRDGVSWWCSSGERISNFTSLMINQLWLSHCRQDCLLSKHRIFYTLGLWKNSFDVHWYWTCKLAMHDIYKYILAFYRIGFHYWSGWLVCPG